jgi:flagellin
MALNAISNYAANVAHRNLQTSDMQATSSLAKLSSGTRVVSARDDAASLAIGSRLNAEVAALRQASVNAGQAVSMLQIADGAMSKVQDILVRMKTLAVQAGSGQLSNTERSMLDAEYQSLLDEVDRIAQDTEFNGNQLINGSITISNITGFGPAAGVINLSVNGLEAGTGTLVANAADLTYTSNAAGGTFTLNATDAASGAATTYTATIDSSDWDAATGYLDTGLSIKLTNGTADGFATISLNTSFRAGSTSIAQDSLDFTQVGNTSYSYKIGSGTQDQDNITISLEGVSIITLGLNGTDVTSSANADATSEAISNAIDTLNTSRARIGAAQNRLDFAAANIASTMENTEAARSNLMDLDIAAEMTTFTSKQILVQSGIAMLAQANQMPQNLLRLFQ